MEPASDNNTVESSQDDSQQTGNTSLTQPATQPTPLLSDEEKKRLWGYLLPTHEKHTRIDFLREKPSYTIGRFAKGQKPACDVELIGHRISREHCRITWNGEEGNTATVKVLDTSTNGTFVNNVNIGKGKSEFLREGNYLAFGPAVKASTSPKPGEQALEQEAYHRYEFHLTASELSRTGLFEFYSLAHVLGNGAFATVKLGMHRATGQYYAVKMIKNKARPTPTLSTKPNAIDGSESLVWSYQKFTGTSEFKIMATLKHPNICELVEWFIEENGDINLVLEYVDGGDLAEYIRAEGGKLDDYRVQYITYQICDAVAYIHKQGVAHRDLKPENILVTKETPVQVKIADFGLAKMLVGETELRTRCGTKPFCAPEIILGVDKGYSLNVDSWSVGTIVYYMFVNHGAYNPECWRLDPRTGNITDPDMDWESLESSNASPHAIDFVQRLLKLNPSERLSLAKSLNHPWFAYYSPVVRKPAATPGQGKKFRVTNLFADVSLSHIPGLSPIQEGSEDGSKTPSQKSTTTTETVQQVQTSERLLSIECVDTEISLGSSFSDMSLKEKDDGGDTDHGEDEEEEKPAVLKRGHSQVSSTNSVGGKEVAETSKAPSQRPTVQRTVVGRKKPRFDGKPST